MIKTCLLPIVLFCQLLAVEVFAQTSDMDRLLAAERTRIQTIKEASASVVCIFSTDGESGGSGVIIDPSGYVLSNYHVVDPCGVHVHCGLNDGKIYDAVLVGVDPVGDLALIKMFGKEKFPCAKFGNSDQVKIGQNCFAVGNPFLLATDFQPSVSWGIISGKNRYQYPSGTLLEYPDCIQTDAAINPGNSGGPLFDKQGKLIGINGRGSFEKRGRVNVGVGYAISITQANRFLGALKSGRIVDHSSTGFTVTSGSDQSVRVKEINRNSDAYRKGIRYDAVILNVAGRPIGNVNDFKNIIGTLPPDWSIPIQFRYDENIFEVMVRLERVHTEAELLSKLSTNTSDHSAFPSIISTHFQPRRGFANYYYNRKITDEILKGLRQRYNPQLKTATKISWSGSTSLNPVSFVMNQTNSGIKIGDETGTLNSQLPFENQTVPAGSGGFLNAIHIVHEVLFKNDSQLAITCLGQSPFVSRKERELVKSWTQSQYYHLLKVLRNGTVSLVYVDDKFNLVAIEYFPFPAASPCRLEFSAELLAATDDQLRLPSSITGYAKNKVFADIRLQEIQPQMRAEGDSSK